MKRIIITLLAVVAIISIGAVEKPWEHGRLQPTSDGCYIQHSDDTPFFWLGDTGWLMPQKLTRTKVDGYLKNAAAAGFNVVQVQVLNGVPSINAYGQLSHPDGWNLDAVNQPGCYGYWDHLDYIVERARDCGIYIGMVCIWGGLVKHGLMDDRQAVDYGHFLAERYGKYPNIVWIIGGDIRGDVKPEVWTALATAIKDVDSNHLMTFHPFGRTSSAYWWHQADWLDMDMFQSGHRRYDQARGDGDNSAQASVAEDNWRYVADALGRSPRKPVIDGEPSYEEIPQGLHDTQEPRWQPEDVRRYAYWSVFAGAAGHTYGHNSVMQMYEPGEDGAYGAITPWYQAVKGGAYTQMQYLKDLMLRFPYFERVPDQTIILGDEGFRYDRLIATRGNDYMMVYNYINRPMEIDLTKISGMQKKVYWFDPATGQFEFAGVYESKPTHFDRPDIPRGPGNDRVLIAFDADCEYIPKDSER